MEEKGREIRRVIITHGNERAGAHTRLSYNQTDIEVYSALNTAFQSGELKMEICENSSWVKKRAGLVWDERVPSGREQKGRQALATRAEAAAGLLQPGTHAPLAADLQMGLRACGLAGLL